MDEASQSAWIPSAAPGGCSAPGASSVPAATGFAAAVAPPPPRDWTSGGTSISATEFIGPPPLEAMMAGNALTPENISGFFVQFPYKGFQLTLQRLADATGITATSQITKQTTQILGPHVKTTFTIQLVISVPPPPSDAAAARGGDEEHDEDVDIFGAGAGTKRRHGDAASGGAGAGDSYMV